MEEEADDHNYHTAMVPKGDRGSAGFFEVEQQVFL